MFNERLTSCCGETLADCPRIGRAERGDSEELIIVMGRGRRATFARVSGARQAALCRRSPSDRSEGSPVLERAAHFRRKSTCIGLLDKVDSHDSGSFTSSDPIILFMFCSTPTRCIEILTTTNHW